MTTAGGKPASPNRNNNYLNEEKTLGWLSGRLETIIMQLLTWKTNIAFR